MQLLTTQAFTTLSLISILTGPLMGFIQSVPRISQSIGCFDRIQEYCSRERTSGIFHSAEPSDSIELTKPSFTTAKTRTGQDSLVTFHDASISWEADSEPVLHDLTLSVPTGKITMVIGPVGCGKSSLLETIMGQTHVKAGSIHRHPGGTAYCPQIPWIMNTSIRDNVTGGTQADQKWYDLTIAACALAEDLEKLAGGDLYIAGSDGVTLSGGQKQRVVGLLQMLLRYQCLQDCAKILAARLSHGWCTHDCLMSSSMTLSVDLILAVFGRLASACLGRMGSFGGPVLRWFCRLTTVSTACYLLA